MVQYTIDDVFGDSRPGTTSDVPIFLPTSKKWDPIGGTCSGVCTSGAHFSPPINATQVFHGTWHTVTLSPEEPTTNITASFTGDKYYEFRLHPSHILSGTQISVYCLLPPSLGHGITTNMNVSITVDGVRVGLYNRTEVSSGWLYNQSIFTSGELENKTHTIVVQPLPLGKSSSFLAFDYFMYEYVTHLASQSQLITNRD